MSRRLASEGAPARQPLVRVRDLTKTFTGGVRALDAVALEVSAGEVLAVVGQNGSGKSTLVKILAGVQSADSGEVDVLTADGQTLTGPAALERLHFLHQDLGLIPALSTIENLDLSRRLGRSALVPVRVRAERREVQDLIERFGDLFNVEAPVGSLSAAEQRIVAIARALSDWKHAENVLVLDEPTVALPGNEVSRLFEAVRRVAAEGAGIIFISHRLDEVLDLADRVVVFRDGQVVADVEASAVDHDELVHLITGRQLVSGHDRDRELVGPPVLSAQNLAGASVRDASVALSPGEIVGVGGLIGSGQEHLAGLLFGALKRTRGEVSIAGESLAADDPHEAIKHGLAFIPADRRGRGAIMDMYARENLTLPRLTPHRRHLGRLDRKSERADAAAWTERVELSPPDPERPLNLFSGGNQQKVVIAKWLRNTPKVLLFDEPTQGVDVGAKASIYRLIDAAAKDGAAVLVTSSDMKELASVCDRVLVMRDGVIAAALEKSALTEANLVSASLGMRQTDVAALFGELSDNEPSSGTQSNQAEVENA